MKLWKVIIKQLKSREITRKTSRSPKVSTVFPFSKNSLNRYNGVMWWFLEKLSLPKWRSYVWKRSISVLGELTLLFKAFCSYHIIVRTLKNIIPVIFFGFWFQIKVKSSNQIQNQSFLFQSQFCSHFLI